LDKGSITESVRRYPVEMTFFSSADNIAIGDVPFTSLNMRPSRVEALKYYRKVVDHFELAVHTFTQVNDIRQEEELFKLYTNRGEHYARKVILAIGYYDIPRTLKIPGENLPHVSHYYDEAYQYTGAKVVVVGGANSAVETALDLYRNGVDVTVVHQFGWFDRTAKYWILPDIENRVKKEEVGTFFNHIVVAIDEKEVTIQHVETGEKQRIPADFVFLMVGYHPDAQFLQKVGVKLNGKMMIPEINPETYESNVPGIYMGGSVIGGEETAKVFIENGKLHAQPIIADIKEKISIPTVSS